MALSGYGLLIGKITASRPARHGSPHWLLMVQPGSPNHPSYRVAVNLQSTEKNRPPELQYQIVNFGSRGTRAGNVLVGKLASVGMTPNFLSAASDSSLPRLDFVRGGIIDPNKFVDSPAGSNPLRDKFEKALSEVAEANKKAGALVAVFGTGYPTDDRTGGSVPTGFTGIDNIHMNQGAMNLIHGDPYYLENGPDQDGGLIFLLPSGAKGFFVKFPSQTTITDDDGNPAVTGIKEIDRTPRSVRKAIMPRFSRTMAARRTDAHKILSSATTSRAASTGAAVRRSASATKRKTNPPGTANEDNYVFADLDPADASGQYIPDNDANTYKTPFVMAQSSGTFGGRAKLPWQFPHKIAETIHGPFGYAGVAR